MKDVFGVGKVVEKLADPVVDLIKRVAGPAADEVGLTFRDTVHVYRAQRAYKLAEKFRRYTTERGIEPTGINLKLLLPILDGASVEGDEDLHTTWAHLLTNAVDPDSPVPVSVSFVNILKELGPVEVKYINALYDNTIGVAELPIGTHSVNGIRYTHADLMNIFVWADLARSKNIDLRHMTEAYYRANKERVDADIRTFDLTLDVITRHDILHGSPETVPLQIGEDDMYSIYGSVLKVEVFQHIRFPALESVSSLLAVPLSHRPYAV